MRKTFVKSLLTIMSAMTLVPSFAAVTLPKANQLTYNAENQSLFTMGISPIDGYAFVFNDGQPHGHGGMLWYNGEIIYEEAGIYEVKYKLSKGDGYASVDGITDGYTYVDLGLESGTLWATYNVGAKSEKEVGKYFQWGDVDGYSAYQSVTTYKYKQDGEYTKYKLLDPTERDFDFDKLKSEDDAATYNWSDSWRMPTAAECNELGEACTWEWIEDYNFSGVSGWLGTAKNGNMIFFPFDPDADSHKGIYMWSSEVTSYNGSTSAIGNNGVMMILNGYRFDTQPTSRENLKIVRPVTKNKGTVTSGTLSCEIKQKIIYISWESNNYFDYDGKEHYPEYKFMYPDHIYEDDKDEIILVQSPAQVNPGYYTATLELKETSASKNYKLQNETKSWGIKRVPSPIKTEPSEKIVTYNGVEQKLYNLGEAKIPGHFRYSLMDDKGMTTLETSVDDYILRKDAGEYSIVAYFYPEDNDFYMESDYYKFTAKILPKEIKVEWPEGPYEYEYSNSDPRPVPEKLVGIMGEDRVSYQSNPITSNKKVGEYNTGIFLIGNDAGNYKFAADAVTSVVYTITPKKLTLELDENSFVYDGDVHLPKPILKGALSSQESAFTVEGSLAKGDDGKSAGEHTVEVTITADETVLSNYSLPETLKLKYTIEKKEITFTTHSYVADDVNMTSFVYNGEYQKPKLKAISGKVGSDDVNVVFVGDGEKNVGYNYSISAKLTGDDSDNYKLATDKVPFRITRKSISVEWGNTTLPYSSTADARIPDYTLVDVVTGEEVNIIESGQESEIGGPYTAVLKLDKTASNYKFSDDISSEDDLYMTTSKVFYIEKSLSTLTLTLERDNSEEGYAPNAIRLSGNTCKGDVKYTYYTDSEFTKKTTVKENGADVEGGMPTKGDSENGGKTYYVKAVVTAKGDCEGGETSTSFRITNTIGKEVKLPGFSEILTYTGDDQPLFNPEGSSTIGTFTYVKQKPGTDAPKPSEYTKSAPEAKDVEKWIAKYVFTPNDTKKYSVISYANFVEILPAELSITWVNTEIEYKEGVEQAPTPVISGALGSDKITYTIKGKETEIGNKYKATIVLDEPYSTNYKIVSGSSQEFSIVPATSQLSLILTVQDWVYGEEPSTHVLDGNTCEAKPTYTYYTDDKYTTLTSEEEGASTEGGVPTYAGTYYVKATVAATGTCEAASATTSFTIAKKNVTITKSPTISKPKVSSLPDFTNPFALVYNEEKQTLIEDGKGSVDGTFVYYVSVDGGEYAKVSGIPSATAAGIYRIKYQFVPTDKNYNTIESKDVIIVPIVDLSKEIVKAPQAVEETYDGQSHAMATEPLYAEDNTGKFEYSNVGELETKYSTSIPEQTEVGSSNGVYLRYVLTAAEKTFNICHEQLKQAGLVSERPLNSKIVPSTMSSLELIVEDWTYGDTPSIPELTGNECKGSETFTYYTDETFTTQTSTKEGAASDGGKPKYAGKYYVKAIVAATAACEAGSAETSFVIAKKELTVKWGNTELKYTALAQTPKAEFEGVLDGDVVTPVYSGAETNVSGAGEFYEATVKPGGASGNNYTIVSNATTKYIIKKGSASDYKEPEAIADLTYSGEKQPLVTEGISGNIPGIFKYALGKNGNFSTSVPSVEDAGDYVVGYQFIPTDPNIADSDTVYISVSIAKVPCSIEWVKTELVYTGSAQVPEAEVKGKIGDDVVFALVSESKINVGNEYEAVATLGGLDAKNYYIEDEEKAKTTFSIIKSHASDFKKPEANENLTYNGTQLPLIKEGKSGEIAGSFKYCIGEKTEMFDTIPAKKEAGEYVVGYKFIPEDAGYYESDTLYIQVKISKKELLIDWGTTEFEYDGGLKKPDPILKGIVNNDVVTKTVSGAQKLVGGPYEAKIILGGNDAPNYFISSANETTEFTIGYSKVEKPAITKLEFDYSGSEITFVEESEDYTITGVASAIEPGSYPVTIVPSVGHVWLDGTKDPIEKIFVIKKKTVVPPAADLREFVYNGSVQTYELTANSAYTITGNKQKAATAHIVTVSLIDKKHYEWSDKTTDDITYSFVIAKAIVKLPKADSVLVYTYDGTEKNFDVTVDRGSILDESNAVGTEAGEYIRTISLDNGEDGEIGGYMWEDKTTRDTTLKFVIEPQPVVVPTVTETYFIYSGEPFKFEVPEDTATVKRYSINMESKTGVEMGTYIATLSLNDKKNYVWDDKDKTTDDKEISFEIGDGRIEKPEISRSYPYTGKEIVFATSTSAYTVTGGKGTEAGSYTVVFTLKGKYTWLDGSSKPHEVSVKIVEKPVEKPTIGRSFTYDGTEKFRVPTSDFYDIDGDTFGIEPGSYKATLALKKNYMWSDSTVAKLVYNIDINRIVVDVPLKDSTEFVYNGKEQTYKIAANPVFTVTNNKQTKAGTYTVTVSLGENIKHYVWNDKTDNDQTYTFVISRVKVADPVAVKSQFTYDGSDHKFEIVEDENYIINPENASGTDVAKYIRTVSLVDPVNYVWQNGKVEDKEVTFEILPISIAVPTVKEEYPYTGDTITFVEETEGYTVSNGVHADAGVYNVVVSLKRGYVWKDGSKEDKSFTVTINSVYAPMPDITDFTFVYDGTTHSFGFTPHKGYTFVGDTAAKEPGVYNVIVKLNENFVWDDETADDQNYIFYINKVEVPMPVANTTKFTYDGSEKTYSLVIPEDSLFIVKNNVHTDAGKYIVSASLKDSAHSQWSDLTTDDLTFDFVINKAKVPNPTSPLVNFIYDKTEKTFEVNPSEFYEVADSNSVGTEAGKYVRTASLKDTFNYMWNDESVAPKKITFTIGDGTLEEPDVKLEYEYTGDTIIFVPADGSYSVLNGAKREVGQYKVVVVPNKGYRWSDGTDDPKVYLVVIKPVYIKKPELQLEYTFNNKLIDFKVPVNEAYDIIGETSAKELGRYKVTLDLLPNYMWSDSTDGAFSYVFSINKKIIPIPEADTTVFVYNAKRQTYNIIKSAEYNVLGNVQAYAGSYEVSVLLTDFTHSIWADSTTEVKTYMFNIARAKVDLPEAVQASFSYDGTTKYFTVTENSRYDVLPKNASASEIGTYERTVVLKDTLNYTWVDGSVTNKTVEFTIGNGTVDVPTIDTVYVYNGTEFTFVPENNAYIVENGKQTNAGTYSVVVKLKDGYIWSDKTSEPKKYTVVIKAVEIVKPVFPSTNVYTYNDSIHGVVIPESEGYTVNGITQTKEPGIYEVTVTLNPNYIWSDKTESSLKYVYTINKIIVEIPAKVDSVFRFTGSEITYPIPDTLDTYIVTGHHRATAGLHYVTVTLTDSLHYMWSDLTTEPKYYEFLIDKYKVELPLAIVDSFVYDGEPKLFEIVANDNYKVERINGAAIEIGEYERKVSLVDTINFLWSDGSIEDKIVKFYITKSTIPSILVPNDLTYTGDTLELIKPSPAYTVTNNKVVNAGVYDVEVIPNAGYTWSDSAKWSRTYTVKVLPKKVAIPTNNQGSLVYNGEPQTFTINIPSDSLFTVEGNVQTEVGKYDVVVALKDNKNYCWSDSTFEPKVFTFVIDNSPFYLTPITQSEDPTWESTPGHLAVFDLKIVGKVFKYWITCDSCPALNVDTTSATNLGSALDILIPDTVKPGVYHLTVSFMSGTLVKSQDIELRVNYPATDIYLVWDDVLTVDNSSGLFKTFQWYKNGKEIPGATKQYYQEKEGLDGYYMCRVNDELFIGPLYYYMEKPLWIKAYGGNGTINVEVIGNIPNGTKVGIYSVSGWETEVREAEPSMTFEMSPNTYLVRLIGPDPTVKFSNQTVKVLVR